MTPYGDFDTDCLVVGGGPAGLIAATYLGRFRRRALVIDGGTSRARWIPVSHNMPGFPDGISGRRLLERLRQQADAYGATSVGGLVLSLTPIPGGFEAETDGGVLRARRVILATGVLDRPPPVSALEAAIATGRVRLCPVCDGYETIGRSVAVLGPPERALKEALFVTAYTDRLTLLRLGEHRPLDDDLLDRARSAGIHAERTPVLSLDPAGDGIAATLEDGRILAFDTLYPALGITPVSGLAEALGARTAPTGCIEVDAHQQTTIPGLYAAGDVVNELNQIAVAAGHAAIAATHVHNALAAEDRRA